MVRFKPEDAIEKIRVPHMGWNQLEVVGEPRLLRDIPREQVIEGETGFLVPPMRVPELAAALKRLAKKKLPYISVLTDPTMGGVSAGFAFVGDVVIAEPKALIGFAGPRVIENTVREKLPEGFQRSEFLQSKGAVDMIVDRRQMRDKLAAALGMILLLVSLAIVVAYNRILAEAKSRSEEQAKRIVSLAIQRYAAQHTYETTTATITLTGDEIKGRIIGRELVAEIGDGARLAAARLRDDVVIGQAPRQSGAGDLAAEVVEYEA